MHKLLLLNHQAHALYNLILWYSCYTNAVELYAHIHKINVYGTTGQCIISAEGQVSSI